MQKEFSYEEIKALVNTLNEKKFNLLKEAINERDIEENNIGLDDVNSIHQVAKENQLDINTPTFLYDEQQIDYVLENLDKELDDENTQRKAYRPIIKESGEFSEIKISEKSREICTDMILGLDYLLKETSECQDVKEDIPKKKVKIWSVRSKPYGE